MKIPAVDSDNHSDNNGYGNCYYDVKGITVVFRLASAF